jgi:hypothetical protein
MGRHKTWLGCKKKTRERQEEVRVKRQEGKKGLPLHCKRGRQNDSSYYREEKAYIARIGLILQVPLLRSLSTDTRGER